MSFSMSEIRSILTFVISWTNISETVHDMTNVSMKDIYEVIYDISVCIMTFDLRCHSKVK